MAVSAIALILSPRLSELEFFRMARIKLQEVTSDTNAVKEIRKRIEDTSKKVASIEKEASSRLDRIEVVQHDAEANLAKVNQVSSFEMLVARARNDNRRALQELIVISVKDNGEYRSYATQAINALVSEVSGNIHLDPIFPWKEGYSIENVSYDELDRLYEETGLVYRPSLLSQVWKNDKYTKRQKLRFLTRAISNTESVRELERACRIIDQEAKLNRNFLGYEDYLAWWQQHEKEYQ